MAKLRGGSRKRWRLQGLAFAVVVDMEGGGVRFWVLGVMAAEVGLEDVVVTDLSGLVGDCFLELDNSHCC